MRTANEMYTYCIKNNFGRGMTKGWALKYFTLIEKALQPDEQALMCFIGLHDYQSSSKHCGHFAYAVTNKRILIAQKKLIGENFMSISIDGLNDISCSTTMLWGIITIDTIKERVNVGANSSVAANINKKIHDVLHDLKSSKSGIAVSSADEILKYKKLLDMGAITKEEFLKKKKELLNI